MTEVVYTREHRLYPPGYLVMRFTHTPPTRGAKIELVAACPTEAARDAAYRLLNGECCNA